MNWPVEPCILENVPAAQYHQDTGWGDVPTLSRSVAHTGITTSWLHAAAEHPRLPGVKARKPSKEMDLGSLVHALLLGGEERIIQVVEADNFRTKAAQEARDAAVERGLTPICRPLYEEVQGVTGLVRDAIVRAVGKIAQPEAFIPDVQWSDFGRELVVLWEEPIIERRTVVEGGFVIGDEREAGIRCRARMDLFLPAHGIIADVKVVTSGYANARKFIRQLNSEDDSGAMQAATYCRGVEAALPHLAGRTRFVFLRVEPYPPYAVVPILVSEGMRSLGEARWLRGVAGWSKCLASGVWPGPGPAVAHVETWAMEREQLAQMGDGDAGE